MVNGKIKCMNIVKQLSLFRKSYCYSKYCELESAKKASITKIIDKHMENFCLSKSNMIRSVLKQSFCKIILNYLVVGNNLFLNPKEVKLKVNQIMVNWIRKCIVLAMQSDLWSQQYASLNYIKNDAFSEVINGISMDNLVSAVKNLLIDKTANISVGSIVKNALKKGWKLWMVLQNMHKAYDLVEKAKQTE
ncbi:hypothetical protein G9A89_021037 [Geosiphon pyriformis]|nr:hypothetical protein G9A89_021037 [Geosiphon pyriformis]